MDSTLRLMCIFAHPDDESLGMGSALAYYAAQGVQTSLLTATRGERGWDGPDETHPGFAAFGKLREGELRCAAAVLGIHDLALLDYIDGDLDQADPAEAAAQIAAHIRLVRPQVVVTFAHDGAYGHPDHIAISQYTSAALTLAADAAAALPGAAQPPHTVAKFYYMVDRQEVVDLANEHLGGITMQVDGEVRRHLAWLDWQITTWVDGRLHWRTAWQAILCHASQVGGWVPALAALDEETQARLWGLQTFYRVYSLVNGGRAREDDLFAGLR